MLLATRYLPLYYPSAVMNDEPYILQRRIEFDESDAERVTLTLRRRLPDPKSRPKYTSWNQSAVLLDN